MDGQMDGHRHGQRPEKTKENLGKTKKSLTKTKKHLRFFNFFEILNLFFLQVSGCFLGP